MQHPVDYQITISPEVFVFRMYEGGCKSTMSKDDYMSIVRQLFLAVYDGANRDIVVERTPEPLLSEPDFDSYGVISRLGSEKLRHIATTQTDRIGSWFNQEADILEMG